MIDVNSKQNRTRTKALINTYVKSSQFGLFLGAGVTAQSHVPTYEELALRILEMASDQGYLSRSKDWVGTFVKHQRELLKQTDKKAVPPEEILLFVRQQLEDKVKLLRQLAQDALYENAAVNKTVGREVFVDNPTLNAILTFCAAPPPPNSDKYPIANPKVGGLLTTNYDNLVEGAFHTKNRQPLLKPVGRPTTADVYSKRPVIPMYHVHGYIGYRAKESLSEEDEDLETKARDIVIAETDYFRSAYDPLGFGNYISMSFLRRFPCLFIGASMKDKNLRRFLFHLVQDSDTPTPAWYQRKFAIIKTCGYDDEELTDITLSSTYGVETIWIEEFHEIESILKNMYTAVNGFNEDIWKALFNYHWGDDLINLIPHEASVAEKEPVH